MKNGKRILSLILVCILLFSCLPAVQAADSGSCGSGLSWRFDAKTGLLTVTGSGKMTEWESAANVPWAEHAGEIRTVTLASGVKSIGAYAFARCSGLTGISIPSTVTSIGTKAFSGCSALPSVSLPAAVSSIGESAFSNCIAMKTISVDAANTVYCSDSSGVLFTRDKSLLIRCPAGYEGRYAVPGTVSEIGYAAFAGCSGLTAVSIPVDVAEIGSYAFQNCKSLTAVVLPDGVTSIGAYAFSSCAGLVRLSIPGSVTVIGSNAFAFCTSLLSVSLPSGVVNIGERAFADCSALEDVSIPSTVTSVGVCAFVSCPALTSVTLPAGLSSIGSMAFGYTFDGGSFEAQKVPGFTVYGSNGSRAQTYASENGFPFSNLTLPKITSQPSSATVDLGKTVTFRITAEGGSLQYQWQYRKTGSSSWTTWSGMTRYCLTVTGSETNNGCQYRCVVSNSRGNVFSSVVVLTVNSPLTAPKITTQPKSASVDLGKSVTFSVTASGRELRYQWQYRRAGVSVWSDWSGKTAASVQVTGSETNNGCQYRCVVSNDAGHANSAAATLTVSIPAEPPKITAQPKSASVERGKTVSFTVSATGTNIQYQWQYRRAGETAWTNWSGRTASSVEVTGSTTNNGCQYRCVVSNSAGHANSAAATLTVTDPPDPPRVTAQPKSATVMRGKTVTFTVEAVGEDLHYQWQYRRAGVSTWTNWSLKTSASVEVTGATTNDGSQYRCVVSNSGGHVNSAAATLTVIDPIDPPKITAQPKSVSVERGKSAAFTVSASGESIRYQWQYRKAGESAWTDWAGATGTSLTVTGSATNNGCQYRCVVSNDGGHANSAAATLTVTEPVEPPKITSQPKSVSTSLGQAVTFTVSASGTGLHYQWQYRKAGESAWTDWTGATGASLTVTASTTNNGCQYRCVVSNDGGHVNSAAATLTCVLS